MHLFCLLYLAWQDPQTWSQGLEISPFVVFCPSLTIDLQSTSIQHFKGGMGRWGCEDAFASLRPKLNILVNFPPNLRILSEYAVCLT